MCKITELLKERFCKDTNLPIKIFEEPYFSERLELYDKQFNCIEKYNTFVETVERYGSEGNYIAAYNELKDKVINFLKENKKMKYFSEDENMSKFVCQNTGFPKSDIYKHTNDGRFFISFDMKKGNFTALKHYDAEIVANKETYEDFIRLFTNEKHFIDSKYIRQVVFGNVNPRRQTTYEQYLMDTILTNVLQYFSKDSIEYFSTDEIVVSVNESDISRIKPIVDNIVKESISRDINIRSEIFSLHKIEGTQGYIKKAYNEDKISIKGVNSLMMPLVLRKLYKEKVEDNDTIFKYEGMTAKLCEYNKIKVPEHCKVFDNVPQRKVQRETSQQQKTTIYERG